MEARKCPKCGNHEGFGLMVKEAEGVFVSCLCGWETMLLTGFCVSNESGVGKKVLIGRVEIKKYARISINEEVVLVENYMPEEIDGDD